MATIESISQKQQRIAVVGLGYVGLPLAVGLARHFAVLGFDINRGRIEELKRGHDRTGEVTGETLAAATVEFSADPPDLKNASLIIVAVPTPIDSHRNPDLTPVRKASETVGKNLSRGSVVVYESTVYPGVTEDFCVPILERESGLVYGRDFTVGYSPERINPGDKVHTVDKIIKVVSGSTPETTRLLEAVYGAVTSAGTYAAPSIRVAEAAKVIENTQRDLNIALMNELALIFDRLGIDTLEVLEAAGTKWNFLPFRPGLVGGHCIGVDPYYLTYKAEEAGYHPQVILAGRRINDTMGKYVAEKCVKMIIAANRRVLDARVGLFGLTFKENVPDLRNTRVVDIYRELAEFGVQVLVHDPLADPAEAREEYGLTLSPLEEMRGLDAIILAVGHEAYLQFSPAELKARFTPAKTPILLDIKSLLDRKALEAEGFSCWRL